MADTITLNAGSGGAVLGTDEVTIATVLQHVQRVKLVDGSDGGTALIGGDATNGLDVDVTRVGGTVTVDGTGGSFPVTDSGGSLTVDNATISVVGGGVEATAQRVTIASDSTGVLSVDDNGGSLTVDGTVTANLAAGTNNIGDVDVLSLPALAAGTNNIGDVDVLSVVPGTSATSLGKAEDAAHTTGDTGIALLAVRRDTAAVGSDTDGDYSTLNVDGSGRLHVNVGNTVTVGSHAVTNAGTFAVQVDGSALTALQLIDNASIADDAAFTPATTGVTMAGFFADEASTDSVDEGDGGAARMTLDRKQIVTTYVHAAAGGATPYKNLDCDESEDEIKATAGKLFWIHAVNLAATKRYLKFYNATAANVTVGTTTPVLSFPVPTLGDTNGAGFTLFFGACGVQFDTAITVAATTGFADADTGAPGANEVILNAGYL